MIGPAQSGIPVPRRASVRRTNTAMGIIRTAIAELAVGGSRDLVYPGQMDASGFSRFIHRAAELEKIKVVTRKTTDATMHVWRIK